AILIHRHAGGFGLFPVFELRGGEIDVVYLPHGRRLTGVHLRGGDAVDRPAVVLLALEPVAVEHLYLVAALDVHPRISPGPVLARRGRLVGDAELDVQLEVPAELLLRDDVAVALDALPGPVHELPLDFALTILLHPGIGVLAVEEDDRAFGWRGARGVLEVLGLGGLELLVELPEIGRAG